MTSRTTSALVWTAFLLLACLLPAAWLRIDESRFFFEFTLTDKFVHCGLFAGFGFLWMLAVRTRKAQLWVLAVGFAFAVLTELGQGFPFIHRDPDLFDAVADVIGLSLGFGAAQLLSRGWKARAGELIKAEG